MVYPTSHLSQENVLRDVHDADSQTLRVSATALVPPGLEVEINHTEDSVRLGNGTSFFTSTTVGPKIGLDVNIIDGITITDGTDDLVINPDGSINVNVVTTGAGTIVNTYNEVTGVANGIPTIITSFTATVDSLLKKVEASGSNIGEYIVYLNSVVIAKKRSYFGGELNVSIEFDKGIDLVVTDLVEIEGTHYRTVVGDFNANIVVLET